MIRKTNVANEQKANKSNKSNKINNTLDKCNKYRRIHVHNRNNGSIRENEEHILLNQTSNDQEKAKNDKRE